MTSPYLVELGEELDYPGQGEEQPAPGGGLSQVAAQGQHGLAGAGGEQGLAGDVMRGSVKLSCNWIQEVKVD